MENLALNPDPGKLPLVSLFHGSSIKLVKRNVKGAQKFVSKMSAKATYPDEGFRLACKTTEFQASNEMLKGIGRKSWLNNHNIEYDVKRCVPLTKTY